MSMRVINTRMFFPDGEILELGDCTTMSAASYSQNELAKSKREELKDKENVNENRNQKAES